MAVIATATTSISQDITWLAVAGTPPGFCHLRSSAIGTLLKDI